MSVKIAENIVLDKFTAVDFLVNGSDGRILLSDISWNLYETFLEDFAERPGWKLTYDEGKLEIMPPTPEHKEYSFSFHDFVRAYCDEFEINLEGRRSTTFRSEFLNKGIEPDECYYIQNADKIIGKKISAEDFPVPDVAVEVDITTESLDKFPIYAALQVSEVWIYDGKNLAIYELTKDEYKKISKSKAMPKLSAADLLKFLKISREKGQTKGLKEFRKWLNKLK
ncbi:MAG: Uma2 family endonuclease [Aridibacter sp.]